MYLQTKQSHILPPNWDEIRTMCLFYNIIYGFVETFCILLIFKENKQIKLILTKKSFATTELNVTKS